MLQLAIANAIWTNYYYYYYLLQSRGANAMSIRTREQHRKETRLNNSQENGGANAV